MVDSAQRRLPAQHTRRRAVVQHINGFIVGNYGHNITKQAFSVYEAIL